MKARYENAKLEALIIYTSSS